MAIYSDSFDTLDEEFWEVTGDVTAAGTLVLDASVDEALLFSLQPYNLRNTQLSIELVETTGIDFYFGVGIAESFPGPTTWIYMYVFDDDLYLDHPNGVAPSIPFDPVDHRFLRLDFKGRLKSARLNLVHVGR